MMIEIKAWGLIINLYIILEEMSSQLSDFHYHSSQIPVHFDFEEKNFDIKNIYNHFSWKVS